MESEIFLLSVLSGTSFAVVFFVYGAWCTVLFDSVEIQAFFLDPVLQTVSCPDRLYRMELGTVQK